MYWPQNLPINLLENSIFCVHSPRFNLHYDHLKARDQYIHFNTDFLAMFEGGQRQF